MTHASNMAEVAPPVDEQSAAAITLQEVSKVYRLHKLKKVVFEDLSLQIPVGVALGICGANGAGKSTLMRMMAGVESPTKGVVKRTMSCSWPIGYASCFQSTLTGADNARFIARIYNQPVDELLDYVQDFAELGSYFRQPINTYSAGMVARLAFGVSLAINFDCYLVDEVTSAGDHRFRERCEAALHARRASGTLVMISHSPDTLKEFCTSGAVIDQGKLTLYDSIEDAIEVHEQNQVIGQPVN